jgi:LmbE family N-acetylglucosaminyl deacetylase
MSNTIIVFSAHTDDFVIGAGGTIKNHTLENKKVISIVFSLGEKSHPWLKHDIIKETRKKETLQAGKILGSEIIILDLKDQNIEQEYQEKNIKKTLLDLFQKEKPEKVFTHSGEDPHPDHLALYKITQDLVKELDQKPELYIYSVWNPVSFKTSFPSFYVDISNTFKTKLNALKAFRSQQVHLAYPYFLLIIRAVKNGLKIKKRYAEMFFRLE